MTARENAIESLVNGGYGQQQAKEIIALVCGEARAEGFQSGQAAFKASALRFGDQWRARCDHIAKQGLRWKAEAEGRKEYGEKLKARVAELEAAAICPSVARLYGSKCVKPVRHRGDHQDETKRHFWSDEYAIPQQRSES